MAYSPNEFEKIFDQAVMEFEEYFDNKLAQHKFEKYDTCVKIPCPKGYTEAHHKVLSNKYHTVGWVLSVYHTTNENVWFYVKN